MQGSNSGFRTVWGGLSQLDDGPGSPPCVEVLIINGHMVFFGGGVGGGENGLGYCVTTIYYGFLANN